MPVDDAPRDVTIGGVTFYRSRLIEHEGQIRCYALDESGVPYLAAAATLNQTLIPGRANRAIETTGGTWRSEISGGCSCKFKGPLRYLPRARLLRVGPQP